MGIPHIHAALLTATLMLASAGEPVGSSSIPEVPQYRPLDAAEFFAEPGLNGTDYSANAPSLSGLTLLATIPAAGAPRAGFFIQAQCTAGLAVVLDDAAGSMAPTLITLSGAAANGGQGGSIGGMPHTGRIRIYSTSPTCQMAARAW